MISGTSHIGKNIYTKDIGGKDGVWGIPFRHEMEQMGDLHFKIKNK